MSREDKKTCSYRMSWLSALVCVVYITSLIDATDIKQITDVNKPEQLSTDDETLSPVQQSEDNNNVSPNNIAFDLPDLTTPIETPWGEFQIEAFKSINNDGILREKDTPRKAQLVWVSVGKPTFVLTTRRQKSTNASTTSMFHQSMEGFYANVEMLTPAHRTLLAETASTKYGVKISERQVVNLILSKFDCSLTLYDDGGNKYLITGTVTDFRHFPLRVDFHAPPASLERKLFFKHVQTAGDTDELRFRCNMASRGKKLLTNTLTITSEQSERIGLETKLFGTSSSSGSSQGSAQTTSVTREQTSELAREMYSALDIFEDYEMPETQFSEAFVTDFISLVATKTLDFTPIDSALASLSRYGFDISADIKPDTIKRDLGQVLKIEKKGDKSKIVVDDKYKQSEENGRKNSGGFSLSAFGIGTSVYWANENNKKTSSETQSMRDQLNELNTESQNDIKWEIEGERIVPKDIKVAQISRGKFSKTLVFSRVRVTKTEAPFYRSFSLYSDREKMSRGAVASLETLRAELEQVRVEMKSMNGTLIGQALKRCRLCYQHYTSHLSTETSYEFCTTWLQESYTPKVYLGNGKTYMRWKIECRAH